MLIFDDTLRTFLEQPLIARLATIGADGYPHVVPIWYMLDADEIVFISDRDTRKAKNAAANAKGAVEIGGDMTDAEGYLIRGELHVADDVDHLITHRMIDRYEKDKASADRTKEAWKNDDIVVIRLTPNVVTKVR